MASDLSQRSPGPIKANEFNHIQIDNNTERFRLTGAGSFEQSLETNLASASVQASVFNTSIIVGVSFLNSSAL